MRAVIIGGGEIGRAIAGALAAERNEVAVIEADETVAAALQNTVDVQVVVGSGTNPQVQRRARVPDADLIAVVTDRDEDNLCAGTLARYLAPKSSIIARIRSPELAAEKDFLLRGGPGLTHVINPELLAAARIFESMKIPSASEVSEFENGKLLLVGIRVPKGGLLDGITLAELPERIGTNRVLVVARYRDDELVVPNGRSSVQASDLLYFIAPRDRAREDAALLGLERHTLKRALVAGATVTGVEVARLLHGAGVSVKLVEPDRRLAAAATEQLPGVLVLHSEPTDPGLWEEENLADVDALAACCRDEEINLMVALYGRRKGVRHTAAVTQHGSYVPLLLESGITTVVSPRSTAISTVLKYLRKGRVLQVSETEHEDAELLEYEVRPKDPSTGHTLRELPPIKGAIVGAILRNGEVIVPAGDSDLRAGDRILVFARKKVVAEVERVMLAKEP